VRTEGRRLFKRIEVSWVAEQMGVDARQALAMMDAIYHDTLRRLPAERAAERTWMVERHTGRRHDHIELRLAPMGEDRDVRLPAEYPLPAERAIKVYYRGERG
jgi:hypothetical protein